MNYSGILYFEDKDVIHVESLIIRPEGEAAFSLVATWNGDRWARSGVALASAGKFISAPGESHHAVTGEAGPLCHLTFSRLEEGGGYLAVEGWWRENNESYFFEGDLKAVSAGNQSGP